jgi:hypothetical protein
MDLLFITQIICEHGEPWRNDIDRGKLVIRPPELSGIPTSSYLVAKQEELAKEMNSASRGISSVFRRVL